MKRLILLASLAFVSSAFKLTEDVVESEFRKFEIKFGKKYDSQQERNLRIKIFEANLNEIETHNAEAKSAYTKAINQFADLTNEEFLEHNFGYANIYGQQGYPDAMRIIAEDDGNDDIPLPEHVDWREKKAINEVRNQGSCGSCWAFSTAEVIESYIHINSGTLPVLSPQQLTSCVPNPLSCGGFGGCRGLVMPIALTYIQSFGLSLDEDYRYISGMTRRDEPCYYKPQNHSVLAQVRGFETLPRNNMKAVMKHLAFKGPLGVSVDASNFKMYGGGVFDGCPFDKSITINHAVVLVGYGTDKKHGKYWIIRNSWSETFGEKGYIRLKRHDEEKCGFNNKPLAGLACLGDGNVSQKVCGTCGVLFDTTYPIGAKLEKK